MNKSLCGYKNCGRTSAVRPSKLNGMTFQPCRPATIKLLPYGGAPFRYSSLSFLSYSIFSVNLLRISRWNHRRYHRKMMYGCWNHRYYPHFSVLRILILYCRGKNHYFWSPPYCPAAHKKPPDPVFAQFSAFFSYFRSRRSILITVNGG